VRLEGRCPAYLTPGRCWANQVRLEAKRAPQEAAGAARPGPALLGGLLGCGRCGQRLLVSYSGRGSRLRYHCSRAAVEYAAPPCQGRAGRPGDDLVAAPVLAAREPAALEVSPAAADDLQQGRTRRHQVRQQEFERAARSAVGRARRPYGAVEPENRLAARDLERRWAESLKGQRRLEEAYARCCRSQPPGLSAAARAQLRALAQDLPALWPAPGTTAADRQRIARLLVEEVGVAVRGVRERVGVTIRWCGGAVTGHAVVRPVQCSAQLADYARLRKRIDELREAGPTRVPGAARLNQEGFRPPRRSQTFTRSILGQVLGGRGAGGRRGHAVPAGGLLGEHAWLLGERARKLGMPQVTLQRWVRVGWVHGRELPTPEGHGAIGADAGAWQRLARLRTGPRGGSDEPALAGLTRPKARDNK
jgi:hypothetical protein